MFAAPSLFVPDCSGGINFPIRPLHPPSPPLIREVESQGVEGYAYNPGYRGRQADGLWLLHHEREIRPLYERMQKVLAVNPAFGEDFLVGQISEDMVGGQGKLNKAKAARILFADSEIRCIWSLRTAL